MSSHDIMIPRYSRKHLSDIWSEKTKYEKWLLVEIEYLRALEEEGIAEKGSADIIAESVVLNPSRIKEIEETSRQDVIAFLTHIEEQVPSASRFLHFGLTSSDILDTGLALQVREASMAIDKDIGDLLEILRSLALANKDVPMIGRTHGIHAEPVTAGLFFAHYYDAFRRHRERFGSAAEEMRVGKLSGAVGTYAYGSPEREAKVLKRLGLEPAGITTQIINRERHANYLNIIALIGTTIEKLSLNIRHHQRTEVSEIFEPFGRGQKGSSAMPHKRNPILSENLCGLARLLRSYAMVGLENVALWHERDISHSSAERILFPDATILLDFMLARLESILKGLVIKPDKMRENLERYGGVIFSEGILSLLIRKGLKRQEAYSIVQRNAFKAIETGGDFAKMLMEDDEIRKLVSLEEINETIDTMHSLRNINEIFKKVFG